MHKCIFFIIDVFSRTKFTIIYNLDNRETPNVNLKDQQIALILIDALGREIEDYERVFNFNVKHRKIEIPTDFTSNKTDYSKYMPKNTIIDIPLRNCTEMNLPRFKEFYTAFSTVYKSGLCLDFSSFNETLFGKYGSVEGYSTLNIYINKCVNSTTNNKTNCLPQNVIDKRLSQNFVNLLNVENDVNSNNFLEPNEAFYKNEILPMSSTIFKNYFKEINSVVFNSDDGLIFENFQKYISYRTDKIIESVDLRGSNTLFPGTYSQITFRCSGKTEIYSRSYMKMPATFAYRGNTTSYYINW